MSEEFELKAETEESPSSFQPNPQSESSAPLIKSDESSSEQKRSNYVFLAIVVGVLVVLALAVVIGLVVGLQTKSTKNYLPSDPAERAVALLTEYPLIDG